MIVKVVAAVVLLTLPIAFTIAVSTINPVLGAFVAIVILCNVV